MIYVDTSALAKVVVDEGESQVLRDYVRTTARRQWVSSIVARTEVGVAIARRGCDTHHTIADTPPYVHVRDVPVLLADVTHDIAAMAAKLGADLGLRTLDAIHVATAVALRPGLDELVTYDRRMMAACAQLSIPTVAPGSTETPATTDG